MSQVSSVPRSRSPLPTLLLAILRALAILWAICGSAGALYSVRQGQHVWAAAVLLGGWSVAVVLLAGAWMIGRTHEFAHESRRRQEALADEAAAIPVAEPVQDDPAQTQQAILRELREIHSTLLLSEPQKQARRAARQGRLTEELRGEFDRLLAGKDIDAAQGVLNRLGDEVPDAPDLSAMEQSLRQVCQEYRSEDIARTTRRVQDFMALADFVQARLQAQALCARYADDEQARDLRTRVDREANAFVAEQVHRLYEEIQRHAEARMWRPALAAARRLLAEYPGTPQADAVAAQIPKLEDNAGIEEVRELRDRIRDMIERRRYAEALDAAMDVIARFPDTQAAIELQGQLERLRQKAGR